MIFQKHRSKHPRRQAPRQPSHLAPGAEFASEVRDVVADGKGVVQHPDGQVFFVPGVWLGERVRVRITQFKGRFGFAELLEIIEASPHRVSPPCIYHGFGPRDCGGCPWQFASYAAQLEAKQKRVAEALAPLAKPAAIKPILPSPQVLGYRNRAQLKTDGQRLGFMASGSRNIADVEDCLVLTDTNRHTLRALRAQLPHHPWQPRHKDKPTTLDIDESTDAASVSVNARLPFQQANDAQNHAMRRWLAEKLANLDNAQGVLELFSGSGNFTEVISEAGFRNVVAVEVVEDALTELRARLPDVKTQVCDLFAADAATRLSRHINEASVLVLDPPRDGLKNDALKSALGLFHKKAALRDVFYISCNLATLVRDLQAFAGHGYNVAEVQPVDQFPHTPHIELMVHLRKR